MSETLPEKLRRLDVRTWYATCDCGSKKEREHLDTCALLTTVDEDRLIDLAQIALRLLADEHEALKVRGCQWSVSCWRYKVEFPKQYAEDVRDGDRPCPACRALAATEAALAAAYWKER